MTYNEALRITLDTARDYCDMEGEAWEGKKHLALIEEAIRVLESTHEAGLTRAR